MDIFLARQPIFDRRQKVIAYELLFRGGPQNFFKHSDPSEATSNLIADSFLQFQVEKITLGHKAFINVTREILVERCMELLPKELYAPEINENVSADKEIIEAIKSLKKSGYLIVLDGFVFREDLVSLAELADIVKIDIQSVSIDDQRELITRFSPRGIQFIAEKVETLDSFDEVCSLGYSFFQGYFFSKPVILTQKDVPAFKLHYLQLLEQINAPDLKLDELEEILKRDVSLTYKLLRYINSPFFGLLHEIKSVYHALVVLGDREVRKWACLIALGRLGEDKPQELLVTALIRAKFCELLAPLFSLSNRGEDLFFLGLFSLIDVMVSRPMGEVLEDIPISEDIKIALLGNHNLFLEILEIVVAYEKGEWATFSSIRDRVDISEETIPDLYIQSAEWAMQSFIS